MARQPRVHLPYAFYHVILRGNNKEPVFFSEADYYRFCFFVHEGIERFNHQIHGFCLMSNHIHLLIQAGENPISQAMQNLILRYTHYINKKHERVGHLFQGRYKSIIIHEQSYLLELIRYIHLNPVEAGITDKPEKYRWSSHPTYLNVENIPWLSTEWILNIYDAIPSLARAKFENFVLKDRINNLGSLKQLVKQEKSVTSTTTITQKLLESRTSLPKSTAYTLQNIIDYVCMQLEIPQSIILQPGKERVGSHARGIIALLVKKSSHLKIKELADLVSRDSSTLSQSLAVIERSLKTDPHLAKIIQQAPEKLTNPKSKA